MGLITRSYNTETDFDILFKEIDGSLDTTNLKPDAAIPTSKTTINTEQGKTAMYVQSITTNALTNNQVIYRGWGYTTNSSTSTNTITITWPNGGFDDATYDVFVTYLGENTAVPASRTDRNKFNASAVASIDTSTYSATQCKLSFCDGSVGGNLTRVIFSWVAIGTKT